MHSVLILGATSDIASALAYEFAQRGFDLVLAARNMERIKPIGSDIEIKYQVSVDIKLFNALDFDSHTLFFESLEKKPDITICVFGYLGDQKDAQQNWAETQKIISTNYTGAVSILNIVANHYQLQNNGAIIGISSVAGERGRQSNYIYGSAKAGFTTYLSGLRNRLHSSGVSVMTVKPGFVETQMTAGMKLPPLLTANPVQVARAIYKAYKNELNVIYVLSIWKWIMKIIIIIPEAIFKKLNL